MSHFKFFFPNTRTAAEFVLGMVRKPATSWLLMQSGVSRQSMWKTAFVYHKFTTSLVITRLLRAMRWRLCNNWLTKMFECMWWKRMLVVYSQVLKLTNIMLLVESSIAFLFSWIFCHCFQEPLNQLTTQHLTKILANLDTISEKFRTKLQQNLGG